MTPINIFINTIKSSHVYELTTSGNMNDSVNSFDVNLRAYNEDIKNNNKILIIFVIS